MTCELMEMDYVKESDKKACFGMFDKKLKGCINCNEAVECSKQTKQELNELNASQEDTESAPRFY